ncbi:unnamed protein product [Soboliphyme baturini]|uniref:Activating signal cointegrator 1 complex subunit 3 n=1 Tax=Soboliphyme baturini TaxID=241478 RepID=A0A183IW95_9BILA|nr:unnamed protein product [Soboliphyme baturini]
MADSRRTYGEHLDSTSKSTSESTRLSLPGKFGLYRFKRPGEYRRASVLGTLVDGLRSRCISGTESIVSECVDALESVAVEIRRSNKTFVPIQLLQKTVLTLLKMFARNSSNSITEKQRQELRLEFGLFPEKCVRDALNSVISLKGCFAEESDFYEILYRIFETFDGLLAQLNEMEPVQTIKLGNRIGAVEPDAHYTRRKQPAAPPLGQQIIVASEEEKLAVKEFYKGQKRYRKLVKKGIDDDEGSAFLSMRNKELTEYQSRPIFSQAKSLVVPHNYRYVFDATAGRAISCYVKGNKMVLPEGSQRRSTKLYDEVYVPASSVVPAEAEVERIKIKDLDQNLQKAFSDLKDLNVIQSIVFRQAYETNENLLVCAPTGAGKTITAILCILRVLKNFAHNTEVDKANFKVVYVAPMKALAAEMVRSMVSRLKTLGLTVNEWTGDVQLSQKQSAETQVIVTTPEKWDVISRKTSTDDPLMNAVRLVIFDEIHLLNDTRGAVIEAIVARTLRQVTILQWVQEGMYEGTMSACKVEIKQETIRLVGLSATLPNYLDVAKFLHVNLNNGLFFFDFRFRPVPLSQTFIGVKKGDTFSDMTNMDRICYEKVLQFVKEGHQVMVFVHSRSATSKLASIFQQIANTEGDHAYFLPSKSQKFFKAQKMISRCRNHQLDDLFASGFSIHNAGMSRHDRSVVERLFAEGSIRVLCCTATLAWGVNLPAHAVIIRGTEVYNPQTSSFIDLGILDVQQIFGRAGRPQFDTSGHGVIITTHDRLDHYLSLLTHQVTVESQFLNSLDEHLNAEISLGTVASVDDAMDWLRFTYFYIRARASPITYGVPPKAFDTKSLKDK